MPSAIPGGMRRSRSAGRRGNAIQRPREPDAPVARPPLQVVAEQAAQLRQDPRLDGGVQPVAAEVGADPGDGDAARRPAHPVRALQQHHAVARPGGALGGADAGGARAQDDQVGVVGQGAGKATVGAPVKASVTASPAPSAGAPITRERTTSPSARRTR